MRFIADRSLGKLSRWLRILGYDTLYWRGDEKELVELAVKEDRVLLTRIVHLMEGKGFKGLLIREDNPFRQLKEVIRAFHLPIKEEALFSRCLECNLPLEKVRAEEVEGEVPEFVLLQHREFSRCPRCQKVFWPGTHYERMRGLIEEVKREIEGDGRETEGKGPSGPTG